MNRENEIFLDTYVLQRDMRIRLPKQVLSNLGVEKGTSHFDIYLKPDSKEIVLRLSNKEREGNNDEK